MSRALVGLCLLMSTLFVSIPANACDFRNVYERIQNEIGVSQKFLGAPFMVVGQDWVSESLNWLYRYTDSNGRKMIMTIVVTGKCPGGPAEFKIATFGKTSAQISSMPTLN